LFAILVSPTFSLVYLVFPHFETVIYLSGVSYVWHAFRDPKDPENEYINSVTILEGQYNVYNADYHVLHHQNPLTFYGDLPATFESQRDIYIQNKATIFRDTQAFELLFWVILKRYDLLAKNFVDLSGKMTVEEITELLKSRLRAEPETVPR